MALRFNRVRVSPRARQIGLPQLTLAHLIVRLEQGIILFARPLLLGCVFVMLAWFGVFAFLYPWAHLAALIFFLSLFAQALGKAAHNYRPVSLSVARRRVEQSSGLRHRPLDVLGDRPANATSEQLQVWQAHVGQTRAQIKRLAWPRWKLNVADRDPYALRYAILVGLAVALLFGWGALGGRVIASLNPALGKLSIVRPTLDAWITPPEYTHLPPIMIATPAGVLHDGGEMDVPEGSTVTAHLAEKSGDAPELIVNDETVAFHADDEHDYSVDQVIHSGDRIKIRRGWEMLGSWKVRVVPDQAPQIAFSEMPSATERKTLKLSYNASDDYGVTSVTARMTPRESLPGVSSDPVDIPLADMDAKQISRTRFEDLTAHPFAGLPVRIQLMASDAAGHVGLSDPVEIILPERVFVQPLARALIEERRKLLQSPDQDSVRNEAANVMAGIAHQTESYHGDPVVMMALRSGAVRLVLDRSNSMIEPVTGLMWQSAVRIEDGATGIAEQKLRKAQQNLADALDHKASDADIQKLVGELHQALSEYIAELAAHTVSIPGPSEELSQLLGQDPRILTPKDFDQMLRSISSLSAIGARDAARQQLAQLQQMLENMRTAHPQLTGEQKQQLQQMTQLKELQKQERQLLDKTYRHHQAGDPSSIRKLAAEQNNLLHQLQSLMGSMKIKSNENLIHSAQAMGRADQQLQQGEGKPALDFENEALSALQQALQSMSEQMHASMMLMQQPGGQAMTEGVDPFGRLGRAHAEEGVKLPDQIEVRRVREILDELQRRSGEKARPRIERDYIDRLLENF